MLSSLGAHTERLGGVRVEREIIHDTLARALIDAGEPDRAAHLLHDRINTRPPPQLRTPPPHPPHVDPLTGVNFIAEELATDPTGSDRAIAAAVGCDHKTVAKARKTPVPDHVPTRPQL